MLKAYFLFEITVPNQFVKIKFMMIYMLLACVYLKAYAQFYLKFAPFLLTSFIKLR